MTTAVKQHEGSIVICNGNTFKNTMFYWMPESALH